MRRSAGFTLIEILLVVVILGALAAMVVPRLSGRSEKAKMTIARVDIEANIDAALKLYELDLGTFPTTDQGLNALLTRPGAGSRYRDWSGPYLEKEPLDPWGRDYQYRNPGTHNKPYDLYSYGPREDDEESWITNWD